MMFDVDFEVQADDQANKLNKSLFASSAPKRENVGHGCEFQPGGGFMKANITQRQGRLYRYYIFSPVHYTRLKCLNM